MKLCSVVFLSLLIRPAVNLWIENENDVRGTLGKNDADVFSQLATKESIKFHYTEIDHLSSPILNKFRLLKKFNVVGGVVKKIYVKPSLEHFLIYFSKTEEIVIEPQGDYNITYWYVNGCPLATFPNHFDRLKLLEKIDLDYNDIEAVEMDYFKSFKQLRELTLYGNKIISLTSASMINLLNLQVLQLGDNKLTELDVCLWNMPALSTLLLFANRLPYVVNILHQFPNLAKIDLKGNALHCDWQQIFLKEISNTTIQLAADLDICNANNRRKLPAEHSCEFRLGALPHYKRLEKSEAVLTELKLIVENLTKKLEHANTRITQLEEQLEIQQNLMSNLMEEFYRFIVEISHTEATAKSDVSP